jgi:hypothetical protein
MFILAAKCESVGGSIVIAGIACSGNQALLHIMPAPAGDVATHAFGLFVQPESRISECSMPGSPLKRARREGRLSKDIVLSPPETRAPAPARITKPVPFIDWSDVRGAVKTILMRLDYIAVRAHEEGEYMAAIAAERTLLDRIAELAQTVPQSERTPEEWLALIDSLKAELLDKLNTVEAKSDSDDERK